MTTVYRFTAEDRCFGRWYLEVLLRQKESQKIDVDTKGAIGNRSSKELRQGTKIRQRLHVHGGEDLKSPIKHSGQQLTLMGHDVTLEEIQKPSGSKFSGQGARKGSDNSKGCPRAVARCRSADPVEALPNQGRSCQTRLRRLGGLGSQSP